MCLQWSARRNSTESRSVSRVEDRMRASDDSPGSCEGNEVAEVKFGVWSDAEVDASQQKCVNCEDAGEETDMSQ